MPNSQISGVQGHKRRHASVPAAGSYPAAPLLTGDPHLRPLEPLDQGLTWALVLPTGAPRPARCVAPREPPPPRPDLHQARAAGAAPPRAPAQRPSFPSLSRPRLSPSFPHPTPPHPPRRSPVLHPRGRPRARARPGAREAAGPRAPLLLRQGAPSLHASSHRPSPLLRPASQPPHAHAASLPARTHQFRPNRSAPATPHRR